MDAQTSTGSDSPRLAPWSWQPGQSGNPGGRPKEHREFKRLCKEKAVWCFHKLVEHAGSDDPSFALRAIELILNYGIGKPIQSIEVSQESKVFVIGIPQDPNSTIELTPNQWLTQSIPDKPTYQSLPITDPSPINAPQSTDIPNPTLSPTPEDIINSKPSSSE